MPVLLFVKIITKNLKLVFFSEAVLWPIYAYTASEGNLQDGFTQVPDTSFKSFLATVSDGILALPPFCSVIVNN